MTAPPPIKDATGRPASEATGATADSPLPGSFVRITGDTMTGKLNVAAQLAGATGVTAAVVASPAVGPTWTTELSVLANFYAKAIDLSDNGSGLTVAGLTAALYIEGAHTGTGNRPADEEYAIFSNNDLLTFLGGDVTLGGELNVFETITITNISGSGTALHLLSGGSAIETAKILGGGNVVLAPLSGVALDATGNINITGGHATTSAPLVKISLDNVGAAGSYSSFGAIGLDFFVKWEPTVGTIVNVQTQGARFLVSLGGSSAGAVDTGPPFNGGAVVACTATAQTDPLRSGTTGSLYGTISRAEKQDPAAIGMVIGIHGGGSSSGASPGTVPLLVGVQARVVATGSAAVTSMAAYHAMAVDVESTSGTVARAVSLLIDGPHTGTGPITEEWAIYSPSVLDSMFGGNVDAASLSIAGTDLIAIGDARWMPIPNYITYDLTEPGLFRGAGTPPNDASMKQIFTGVPSYISQRGAWGIAAGGGIICTDGTTRAQLTVDTGTSNHEVTVQASPVSVSVGVIVRWNAVDDFLAWVPTVGWICYRGNSTRVVLSSDINTYKPSSTFRVAMTATTFAVYTDGTLTGANFLTAILSGSDLTRYASGTAVGIYSDNPSVVSPVTFFACGPATDQVFLGGTNGNNPMFIDVRYKNSGWRPAWTQILGQPTIAAAGDTTITTVPTGSSFTGVKGQLALDSGFIYICTAAGTWKRAALSTF